MSTKLGIGVKDNLKHQARILFGHAYGAFQNPLAEDRADKSSTTDPRNVQMWWAMQPAELRRSIEYFREKKYDLAACHFDAIEFVVCDTDHKRYRVRMNTDYYHQFVRGEHIECSERPSWKNNLVWGIDEVQKAFPGTSLEFECWGSWMRNAGQVGLEFDKAYHTFEELVEMMGTAGQLVRALPELKRFMEGDLKTLLERQVRASIMPFEWNLYDRDNVRQLEAALLKAELMPVGSSRDWGTVNNFDWAWLIE